MILVNRMRVAWIQERGLPHFLRLYLTPNTLIVIQTSRLWLQHAQASDAAFFYDLLNTPTWLRYIGDRGIHTQEDARKYIQHGLIRSYEQCGFGLYKMVRKEDRAPIGLCGLVKRPFLPHPDLGFALLPTCMRQGYMYEAGQATLKYAATRLAMKTLLAITALDNFPSQGLLKKLGFSYVKQLKPSPKERVMAVYEIAL